MLSTRSLQFFELPQSFGYDPNSNRSSQIQNGTPSIYQINAANNRIDSISGFARNYTYKATGQTTAITGGAADLISESGFETPLRNLNLTYDSFNRLNGVTGQNLSATYKIAATNMRVEKNANSKVTKFVYGLGGQLLFERDINTTRDTQHLYFQGDPIGIVRNSSLYFVIPDHLGRPEMMMDSTAAAITVWRAVLTAFDRQSIPINTIGGYHIGFPGQYHDEETGFAHNVNRDYDPATGRYLQSDPIGLAGGLDTYGYVGGNPVSYVDPLGLDGIGSWTYPAGPMRDQYNENLGNGGGPDFFQLSATMYVLSFSVTLSRSGNLFQSFGVGREYPNPVRGLGASLNAGILMSNCPDAKERAANTDKFLTGLGYSATAHNRIGVGAIYSPGSGGAILFGVGAGIEVSPGSFGVQTRWSVPGW